MGPFANWKKNKVFIIRSRKKILRDTHSSISHSVGCRRNSVGILCLAHLKGGQVVCTLTGVLEIWDGKDRLLDYGGQSLKEKPTLMNSLPSCRSLGARKEKLSHGMNWGYCNTKDSTWRLSRRCCRESSRMWNKMLGTFFIRPSS